MTRNNLLFTGPPGCGKTTLISRIIPQLRASSTGFLTTEIREKGERVGFSIDTLDGKEALLAHVNVSGRYTVGRYGVVLESIENIAIPSMMPRNEGDSVVIDEIGKMEYFSPLFRSKLLDVLEMPNMVIGTISLRGDQFTYGVGPSQVIDNTGITFILEGILTLRTPIFRPKLAF